MLLLCFPLLVAPFLAEVKMSQLPHNLASRIARARRALTHARQLCS